MTQRSNDDLAAALAGVHGGDDAAHDPNAESHIGDVGPHVEGIAQHPAATPPSPLPPTPGAAAPRPASAPRAASAPRPGTAARPAQAAGPSGPRPRERRCLVPPRRGRPHRLFLALRPLHRPPARPRAAPLGSGRDGSRNGLCRRGRARARPAAPRPASPAASAPTRGPRDRPKAPRDRPKAPRDRRLQEPRGRCRAPRGRHPRFVRRRRVAPPARLRPAGRPALRRRCGPRPPAPPLPRRCGRRGRRGRRSVPPRLPTRPHPRPMTPSRLTRPSTTMR